MRVAVTGAGGFVGRRLVAALIAAGHEPLPSDRELDVTDAGLVRARLFHDRPDAIVHLAAISSVRAAASAPERAWRVNLLGARSVLEAAAALARDTGRRPRVVLVGSGQVYGPAHAGAPPFDEDAPLRPRSAYDWTKAAADLLGASHAARGADVVRVRPFNHTGPGQAPDFVASSFARQLAEIELGRRPPELAVGNLDSVRDFLDVEDVIDAYLSLLAPGAPSGVFNVASGRGLSGHDLVARLLATSTARPRLVVEPARVRPTDASVGNAGRLRTATGWAPRRDLDDTLGRLLNDWRLRLAAA